MIFIVEIIAFRWGTAKLASIGFSHDAHGHGVGGMAAHGPENTSEAEGHAVLNGNDGSSSDEEKNPRVSVGDDSEIGSGVIDSALTQIIGIAILEFGILLHRYERRS